MKEETASYHLGKLQRILFHKIKALPGYRENLARLLVGVAVVYFTHRVYEFAKGYLPGGPKLTDPLLLILDRGLFTLVMVGLGLFLFPGPGRKDTPQISAF